MRERLALGFRFIVVPVRRPCRARLDGRRSGGSAQLPSAYPNLVRKDLADKGIKATVIRLDGAVEISIQLGVADAIADVVGSGRTLALHNLVAFGQSLCDSEAVLIERDGRAGSGPRQLAARVQGVVSVSST